MDISLAEWLALCLFCLSALRALIELVIIPRWYGARKNTVGGQELTTLIERKRKYEAATSKTFTLSLMLVTGASLFLSFTTPDVEMADVTALKNTVRSLSEKIEMLEQAAPESRP